MNVNLLDQQRCAEIFERVRRASAESDIEVTVLGGHSALTRFANNEVTQNVSEEDCEVSVRVQMGGRTARATTNRLDDESLREVVARAEALTRVQEEDPDLLPMLTAAGQGRAVELEDRWCEETSAMGAGERAEEVSAMVALAKREGLNAAGAIGDDRLQKMATGHVSPENFTHGSSRERTQWFQSGFASGRMSACDTFARG